MLHEREPGAAEFARELRCRGVPVESSALRFDLDPVAFAGSRAACRARPGIVHTHLVHGDAYGLPAGVLSARAAPFLDEARLQRVPRAAASFALGDRAVCEPRAAADRDLARARRVPRGDGRGSSRTRSGRPLRDRRRRRAAATAGRAAPACASAA